MTTQREARVSRGLLLGVADWLFMQHSARALQLYNMSAILYKIKLFERTHARTVRVARMLGHVLVARRDPTCNK